MVVQKICAMARSSRQRRSLVYSYCGCLLCEYDPPHGKPMKPQF
ncbi:MAG: hypothetical protein RMY30_008705 [Nostoc sp. CmiSLP01]